MIAARQHRRQQQQQQQQQERIVVDVDTARLDRCTEHAHDVVRAVLRDVVGLVCTLKATTGRYRHYRVFEADDSFRLSFHYDGNVPWDVHELCAVRALDCWRVCTVRVEWEQGSGASTSSSSSASSGASNGGTVLVVDVAKAGKARLVNVLRFESVLASVEPGNAPQLVHDARDGQRQLQQCQTPSRTRPAALDAPPPAPRKRRRNAPALSLSSSGSDGSASSDDGGGGGALALALPAARQQGSTGNGLDGEYFFSESEAEPVTIRTRARAARRRAASSAASSRQK